MEKDFRWLRDKYGDAGAREVFEKICTELLIEMFGEKAHNIRSCQGDGGIDILIGDFQSPIDNYQCKYFIEGINDSQKDQIRKSFVRAISSSEYKMKKWVLCLPCILSIKEFSWWSEWKSQEEKKHGVIIGLFDGSYLIAKLKGYDMYKTMFDEDIRMGLEEIYRFMSERKKRISEEIIVSLNEEDSICYNDMLFVKKLENAKINCIEGCKKDFFNAEFTEYIVKSKANSENLQILNNLKIKIHSLWQTQYRAHQDETDGNILLTKTYERIEDTDTTTLDCSSLPEINLLSKKGIVHQWAEECGIGWLKDYKKKLELYILEDRSDKNEN